jgi:hypothetical protein
MNNRFDELAKAMAQSATRRAALKRFGVGLGAFALAALGLENKAQAGHGKGGGGGGIGDRCKTSKNCQTGLRCINQVCAPPSSDGGPCETNEDCATGLRCLGGHPLAGYTCTPPSGRFGPCRTDEDCAPGLVCEYYGLPPAVQLVCL